MRSSTPFFWTLLLAFCTLLWSRGQATSSTPCLACEAWEALQNGYNSTGNLTDIGYNRTAGGTYGQGGMNQTTGRNASIPMPNGTAVPKPTENPRSHAEYSFTAKTTAATLVVVIVLLTV